MMRRVRVNIETLIAKLLQSGFVFGYDVRLQKQLAQSLTSPQDRRQYQEMRNWVHEQPPVFLPAKQRGEEIAETEQFLEQDPSLAIFVDVDELGQEKRRVQQATCPIDVLEQIVGLVPLAVRAWFEEVEAVNFFGYHPQWSKLIPSFPGEPSQKHIISDFSLMSSCDPFQICALNKQKIASLQETYLVNKDCRFEFAPDRYFKDYYGGSSTPYTFVLPQASIDAIMPAPYGSASTTFVEYIRLSLECAGFPGMIKWSEIPHDDLNFLTHDLLPF